MLLIERSGPAIAAAKILFQPQQIVLFYANKRIITDGHTQPHDIIDSRNW